MSHRNIVDYVTIFLLMVSLQGLATHMRIAKNGLDH